MKPILFCFSFFLLLSSITHAFELPPLSIDGNIAYFRPETKKLRRIYSNGWADYQLNVNLNITSNWQAWAGFSYGYARGHSLCKSCSSPLFSCERHSTNLTLLPIYLGVKYIHQFKPRIKFYFGGGVAYSFLKINDHFSFVERHIKKQAFGGLIQTGTLVKLYKQIYLNIFLDYFLQKFEVSTKRDFKKNKYVKRNDLNLNGFKSGIGLGLNF